MGESYWMRPISLIPYLCTRMMTRRHHARTRRISLRQIRKVRTTSQRQPRRFLYVRMPRRSETEGAVRFVGFLERWNTQCSLHLSFLTVDWDCFGIGYILLLH